jgi:CHAD domain-containing protein
MLSDGGTLDRPTLDVIARIARRQLRAADAAARRLAHDDRGALHDFRVALRKLRSTLRAYAPQLDKTVRPKDRRRLKRLARVTSGARDVEVQIVHLRALRDDLGPDEQGAVAFLLRPLRRRMRDEYASVRAEIEASYPRTARALARRLRRANTSESLPVRLVMGPLLAAHAADLRPLLEHVPSVDDTAALHQARIEVKRVRYLLEPVRHSLPGSTTLLRRLERLQDLLGELHDFEGLAEALRAARVTSAARRGVSLFTRLVRERRQGLHADLVRDWLGAHAGGVLEPLEILAERLGGKRHATLALRPSRIRARVVVNHPGRC